MNSEITKQWTFDAAHQLPNHDGKCRNLHGHTYTVIIGLEGPIKGVNGDPDEGMVIDYYHLGEFWKEELEPKLDHKFLNETLPIPITTAECIAAYIFDKVEGAFPSLTSFVTVKETPNTSATARR